MSTDSLTDPVGVRLGRAVDLRIDNFTSPMQEMIKGASFSWAQQDHDVASSQCTVLPGFFGYLVQFLLFLVCVGVLVFKKYREGPGRTWLEFGLDSSKQFIGSGYVHLCNLGTAKIMHKMAGGSDECTWYWIEIMIDDTLGTLVTYLLLLLSTYMIDRWLECCLSDWVTPKDFHTGEYMEGGAFKPKRYFLQLTTWLCIITCMKFLMVLFIVILRVPLRIIGNWILHPFYKHSWLKLLFVMIITPVVMNSFQYFVTDNFIMKKKPVDNDSAGEVEPLLHDETHENHQVPQKTKGA